MSLRNLEIFSEVCRHMNMSRAAEKLYISQSSVSQAIAELEKKYGVRLFERISKKLYLTEQGKELLMYTGQILHLVSQMEEKMSDLSSREWLRIGACTTVGMYFMNPLLDQYQEHCPSVRTTVEVGNSTQLEQKLLSCQLDLAFIQEMRHQQDMLKICSLEDQLVLVCSKDHPMAGKQVEGQDLDGQAFVVREEGSGTRKLMDQFLTQYEIHGSYAWICSSVASLKEAVLHGRGISLLSEHLVHSELEQEAMGKIQIKGKEFRRNFYLVCHRNKYQTPAMKQFFQLCRKKAGCL